MAARNQSARISPTAWYTGQVWNRNGLSEDGLMGWAGPLLHALGAPLLVHVPALFGVVTMDQILLARHLMLDAAVSELVQEQGVRSAMEIAAGLGARGLRMVRRYQDLELQWVDADLPEMAALRRRLLSGRTPSMYEIRPIDLLALDGELSISRVLSEPPLDHGTMVLMEGLLNYFPFEVAQDALRRLAQTLHSRSEPSFVVFEVHTERDVESIPMVGPFLAGLSVFARGRVSLHYPDVGTAVSVLHDAGFSRVVEARLAHASAWPAVRVLVAAVHDPGATWPRQSGPLREIERS